MDRISSFKDVQKMILWPWLDLFFWKVIGGIAYGEWKSFGIMLEIFWDNVVNILWINGPKVIDVLEFHRLCFG